MLDLLGSGAMGAVFAAYDPELDRRLAVKVLLEPDAPKDDQRGHRRLLQEAQAMAKLDHPNVVPVHDVGEIDGRVFVAMELIEGQTLGAWLSQPRRWPDVVDVFLHAAAGLGAAHEQSIVHQDFKPDNVMIDAHGRIRVMDFGLARSDRATSSMIGERSDDAEQTWGGALVGTPAYMAPELLAGMPAGPASDQFAFCVSLWEALYGQRPYKGQTIEELATNVLEGRRASPPARLAVPRWLRRICERGLAPEPDRRFATMDELRAALARGRGRARLRMGGVAVLGAAVAAAAVLGVRSYDHSQTEAACIREGESISRVWDDETGADLRRALVGSGLTYADVGAARAVARLDEHAAAWATARSEVCMADADGAWDRKLVDRATLCLDERRMQMSALVDRLLEGDRRAVERAAEASAGLASIDPCIDRELLRRLPEPGEIDREDLDRVRLQMSRASALLATGAYDDGLRIANAALEDAETVGWPPLVAAARTQVGRLLEGAGKEAEAKVALQTAFFEAADAGALEQALLAADTLTYTVGERLADREGGMLWAKLAGLQRSRLPDPTGLNAAVSLNALAGVHLAAGEATEAVALREQALPVFERVLGPDHPRVAHLVGNLAEARRVGGDYDEALKLHRRALSIREQALGRQHPDIAVSLHTIGAIHLGMGRYGEARPVVTRALEIAQASMSPSHPLIASILANLAITHHAVGELEQATELYERSLAAAQESLGPEHPAAAGTMNNLGELYRMAGDTERALAIHARALAIREKALGPDHPDVGESLGNLAGLHLAAGDYAAAQRQYERALAIYERSLGVQHPRVGYPVGGLANVALARAFAEKK